MSRMKRSTGVLLGLLVVAGVTGVLLQRSGSPRVVASKALAADGVVAAERIVVLARVSGVVQEIVVKEGDALTRGQVVARLEDPATTARVAQARQALAAVEAKLRSEQAGLAVQQARVPLAIKAAEANAELTRTQLQQQEALEEQHWQEVERLRAVTDPDDETRERLADAELAYERAQHDVAVARAAVDRAESDLELVRLGREEIVAHIAEVEALAVDRERAEVSLHEAEVGIKDLEATTPLGGTVIIRRAAAGDSVVPGTPLVELNDLKSLYVIAELGTDARPRVRTGQKVRVRISGGDIAGVVSAVLPEGAKIECDSPGALALGTRVGVVWDAQETP